MQQRFCRKVFARLKNGPYWTQLSCESRKLIESRNACLSELARADHIRSFGPCKCCCHRMERVEAQHWSCNPLGEPVILFDTVVEVFGFNDPNDPTRSRESEDNVETLQTRQIGTAFVDGNAVGDAVCNNCAREEPPCSSTIPAL